MSGRPDTALVRRAWDAAVTRRRPGPDRIVHSDRGCQYTSAEYRRALADRRVVPSYSRKGNCWDNAPMESFFASRKKELVYREWFPTRADAERAVFESIEVFYNRVRRHSTLGYVAPAAFEAGRPWHTVNEPWGIPPRDGIVTVSSPTLGNNAANSRSLTVSDRSARVPTTRS